MHDIYESRLGFSIHFFKEAELPCFGFFKKTLIIREQFSLTYTVYNCMCYSSNEDYDFLKNQTRTIKPHTPNFLETHKN